ncbi:hypothetical protein ACIB24_17070 [Spongisporangium articulatum]|uniref:Uncharacterized protein n=1 Tax=Spongisporangium articulatum TaxID=3362603 RepID=A0ABW8ARS5_9ACTN
MRHHDQATTATALQDQAEAAARQASQALRDAALADPHITYSSGRAPLWVAAQLANVYTAVRAGTATYCPHIDAHHPRIVHAAVWAPGLITCTDCVPELLMPDPIEDDICDRCHQLSDRLHPGAIAGGPLLLTYGLCPPCDAIVNQLPAA